MFITPELFEQAPDLQAYEDRHHPDKQSQDIVVMSPENGHTNATLGKRKRPSRSHDMSPNSLLNSFHDKSLSSDSTSEVPQLSSTGEAIRTVDLRALPTSTNLQHVRFMTYSQNDIPPPKVRRKIISPKALRTNYQKPICETYDCSLSPSSKGGNTLKACHLCHKRPTQKKDLDAFADCLHCQERTCFVCIRECSGSCGARRICRNCCVEKGEEGDTWCFECLGQTPDQEMKD